MRRLLFTAALLTACASDTNELEGSISDEFSLAFDEVDLSIAGCGLRIDYIKNYGTTTYVPCRLDIDTEGLDLTEGSELESATFATRVELGRSSPTGRYFPDLERGTLHFERFSLVAGETASGSFEVEFEDGRDLRGRFHADLRDRDPANECD
jgi:hypothetical protein